MHTSKRTAWTIFTVANLWWSSAVDAQSSVAASIPGIEMTCKPPRVARPWLVKEQSPECRALEVIAALTPEERRYFQGGLFALGSPNLDEPPTGGGLPGSAQPSDRAIAAAASARAKLKLPRVGGMADGPHGIATMANIFGAPIPPESKNITAFPNVITLGATWDRILAARFGAAVGAEFRAKGITTSLGPTANLVRSWHGGRSAELFGEDPFHTSELVVPEINALQAKGVIAMLKHFVANEQEFGRLGVYPDMAGVNEHISEKALQEVYYAPFRAAVKRARAGAIMCSYNQINGEFGCNSTHTLGQLRQWGFDGMIVPDAVFAQRDVVDAARAGVDGTSPIEPLEAAVAAGQLESHYFDRRLYHLLVPRFRHGLYDKPMTGRADAQATNKEHVALAREIAIAGTVLLKNKGDLLPLKAVKSIAVIGADAGEDVIVMETGSPNVHIEKLSVPLAAIRARAGSGITVSYERGNAGVRALPVIPAEVFSPPSKQGNGLQGEYFGTPWYYGKLLTRIDAQLDGRRDMSLPALPAGLLGEAPVFGMPQMRWSARWTGTLTPPVTGLYSFSLSGTGTAALYLDHRRVTSLERTDFPNTSIGSIHLTAGRPVQVFIHFDNASVAIPSSLRLGWEPPSGRLERAVAAAKDAYAVIVFAGEQLGEGYDKHHLALPGDQNSLIEAVAAANPRTVVVLHTSTAVAMPWVDKVATVVAAWYPGQEAGSSIAAVLFGDENPSGKLPMTFPRDESQGAVNHWMRYPGDGRNMQYDEGVFVGYRWFDAHGQDPLFPFGHGLSYTRFEMNGLQVSGSGDRRFIELDVTNVGQRDGSEVVQVYVGMPSEAGQPPQVLKGFEKVAIPAGAKRHVKIALADSELAIYDESLNSWRIVPGAYEIMIGASSSRHPSAR